MSPPEVQLDEEEHLRLKHVGEQYPKLDASAGHVRSFAQILTQRDDCPLDGWIHEARNVNLLALQLH
ncbi:hypothetical protein GCM10009642_18030 [Nocardiopsis metallicus]